MTPDLIRVRGARQNNLKNVSVDLPKRQLTVFTGLSGSGKSSLVYDTIAAEAQRALNETHSAFVQGFLPTPPRPDADEISGITAAISVSQEPLGANPRSTVGTATDIDAKLRVLFSRCATPHIGGPQAFSFNVPSVTGAGAVTVTKGERKLAQKKSFSIVGGMCPKCEGRGEVSDLNLDEIVDMDRSIDDGAILVPGYKVGGWSVRQYSESGFFPSDKPLRSLNKRQLETFLYGEQTKVVVSDINITYEGLIPRLRKSIFSKDIDAVQPHIRAFIERAATFAQCPDCEGTRLAESARSAKLQGLSIAEANAMEVRDLLEWVRSLDIPDAAPVLGALTADLGAMVHLGLGYLSLGRAAGSLSGGEAQRVRMVRHLGSALSDVTYIFDEPTTGLHAHDIAQMNELLLGLRDKGNTVLVVEHDPATIAIADHIVDMGPAAGNGGGEVVYEGDKEGLAASDTLTGRYLSRQARIKDKVRTPKGVLEIRGASSHNLKDISVDIPLGCLCVITGVAGSGKSSLIPGSLPPQSEALIVDQTPIKGSSRSNAATWTGMLDPIRKAFAKAHGVSAALFSANSEGACPHCSGSGKIRTEFGFMETVETVCEVCEGRRFDDSIRQYTLGGLDIVDVLALSAQAVVDYFSSAESKIPAAKKICEAMTRVGLGYLTLGQPLSTLSGGERQRLRLAAHLGDAQAQTFILDEPTTGLHVADVDHLLSLLDYLVDHGKSVIVVEHDLSVIAHADWIIDIGPGAGSDGGEIVFHGTPADLIQQTRAGRGTLTGKHLALHIDG
ncbi:MAG: excinuclease ABC subunit UvrA [Actinomycetaceae bacterium]|nr:excinuclease ABC subunit UvrA [Actinomycetaceae bacterium]